jgi:hypothetical protein
MADRSAEVCFRDEIEMTSTATDHGVDLFVYEIERRANAKIDRCVIKVVPWRKKEFVTAYKL